MDTLRPATALTQTVALRRTVLAVSVLDNVDLMPGESAVTLQGDHPDLALSWDEIALALGDNNPDSDTARRRLRTWVQLRVGLARLADPESMARPVGLPTDHPLHPGRAWVRASVAGEALDLGLGLLGLLGDPDEVVVAPPALFLAAGIDADPWWPHQARELEQTGRLAAERLLRDETSPLRPFGDLDVLTLLCSTAFRAAICDADPVGWRTAAVPMRTRGWLDLGRIDPAFAAAAALATDPDERGFDRAVLVTPEEVVMVGAGGRSARHALQDPPARIDPWLRGQ
ncbi:MAG: hypothetical protein LH645_00605 [Actinomycetia bacterium]|nr:hypothetical protein [Actinomycetes bacterium]